MGKPNVSTKPWNSTSASSPTTSRTTGVPFFPLRNSPITLLLMLLLEYHHSLPTKGMIQLSPFIWNTNLLLPVLTNSSLTSPNFMKNSRRPSFYPRNITNVLWTRTGSLLQTSKLVTESPWKLSSSVLPARQRNSPKNILVLTRLLTKQVLSLGLSDSLTPCTQSILSSMFPC